MRSHTGSSGRPPVWVALLLLGLPATAAGDEPRDGFPLPPRVGQLLEWLPADTETVIVSQGPFDITPAPRGPQPARACGSCPLSCCSA
jgi:hypothetical protein